jgi:protein-S-isoprenylcysteine O-methyltransferase Ste14
MPGIQLLQYGTLQHIVGDILIYIASFSQIFGFFSLNTSAGIVPANRGIKTQGMYKFVRHPIYLGSMFQYVGCFLLNSTGYNAVILLTAACLQIWRLQNEEKLLIEDPAFQEYTKVVKWKLVPGIF